MALNGGKTFVHDEEKQRLLLEEHTEKHFTAGEVVRDIIIGVSDGLTVPFALAAGLSGANASSALVLTAGLAEVAAGAISMGLGGDSTTTKQADYVPDTLHTEQMTEQAGLNCSGHSDILLHLNALNKQVRHFTGLGNTPMTYNLRPVIEEIQRSAEDSGDKRNLKMCLGMLKSMRNRCDQNFVAYRKGLGVVCNKKGGFGVDDFVVEFFGELLCVRVRYLAAKSEADHYNRELQREQDEIDTVPDVEAAEIADILSEYGLGPQEYGPVVTSLRNNPKAWLEFMMKFELGLEKPEPRRALVSAATIALSYVAGGLVPLLPYMFVPEAGRAMAVSVAVTLAALLFFGFVKGRFTGDRPFFSAVQTTVVGALASAAAYAMARAVQSI
ncbi:Vacuolar iron transporter 1.2 [Zea mays]|uniref:Vacuolar iron transporter 1.2 n=3 Tax=Zea mays TaxID=4577 RepID=A0A8J8XRG1_MAIZE|nr:Vacuolar iron transporter 1 [Zea mays]ONM21714.1 Vacuolar iron transporter 1 [Zea mays]PWZ36718.1 hypothetical protein Zm00014a_027992 [Zea mays]PWZ36719.1 Vacuolar iron transporter 1.2 [Zea mays]